MEGNGGGPSAQEQGLGRQVYFGEVPIQEDLTNRIPEAEFSGYTESFALFQGLAGTMPDRDQKLFLTSPDVYALCMGLASELSFEPGSAAVLAQALREKNALDRFHILRGTGFDSKTGERISLGYFYHKKATEQRLRDNQAVLGITIPEGPLSDEEVINHLKTLYSDKDRCILAQGLLSGFPPEDVQAFSSISSEDERDVIGLEDSPTYVSELQIAENPHPNPTFLSVYSKPFVERDIIRNVHALSQSRFKGFGISYMGKNPLSEGTRTLGKKLLEIDRRLGVQQFVDRARQIFVTPAATVV